MNTQIIVDNFRSALNNIEAQGAVDVLNSPTINGIMFLGNTTIDIDGYQIAAQELKKKLEILDRIIQKDYPEEMI